jgi:hypothetical protein
MQDSNLRPHGCDADFFPRAARTKTRQAKTLPQSAGISNRIKEFHGISEIFTGFHCAGVVPG